MSHVQAAPRGRLKLNAPMSFGILHLGPALPEFLMRYPEIALDVSYNDRFVDVIEEGYDVTHRLCASQFDLGGAQPHPHPLRGLCRIALLGAHRGA